MPSAPVDALLSAKADFQRALLDWYRSQRRTLPWREAPSLYKTVVSEFMLQQTQVKTVLPYFSRWLEALPDFAALASASEDRVIKLWEGLGYYSRARNLHRLGRAIAALPRPPETPEAWQELPGVGPYTAAAVTSIAFSHPTACVDGNVVRILARLIADASEYRDSASAAKAFTPLAAQLVSTTTPGDHNQAMMELGATVCTRANPLCTTCPVFSFCAGRRTGEPEQFPRLTAKKMEQVAVTRVWCLENDRLLVHRAAAAAKRLADLHELPTAAQLGLTDDEAQRGVQLTRKKRGITRYQITETIFAIDLDVAAKRRVAGLPTLRWVPLAELDAITFSGPHRRWANEILAQRQKISAIG